MTLPALPSAKRQRLRGALAIAVAVTAISALHYVTSLNSIVLHEVFKRFYYVPIVVAAVTAGRRGGLAVSGFSTLLYLPHVALQVARLARARGRAVRRDADVQRRGDRDRRTGRPLACRT